MSLTDLGEFGLIGRIRKRFPAPEGVTGIGDDCAVIPQRSGQDTLVSTDMLVEGTHFLRDRVSPFQLGWKSAAVNLSDRADATIRSLSHGMRKRVMLAQCFVGNPEVVLLDEPLNGLDPAECARMRRFIAACRGRRTIVVSSHNLHDIEVICTHTAFVEAGRVTSVSTLGAITQASGRVVYTLAARPADMSAIEAAVPGASFEWSESEHALTCLFHPESDDIAAVNRRLLPALLAQTDILSVVRGQSLEEAYLGHRG